MDFQEGKILTFGDMNRVLEPTKGKSKKTKGGSLLKNVVQYMDMLHLIDTWRVFNSNSKIYTFYSHKHQTYSRIDMGWMSNNFFITV